MNKKIKLIIEILVFILVLVSITFGYNYLMDKPDKESQELAKKENIEIIEIKNTKEFEKEVINEEKTVIVDFYATWCKPCKIMTPIIEEIASEHTDIKFVKVDIDRNEELAIKYNVMSIPTIMIMKNGEISKTFIGVTDKEAITKEL